MCIYLYKIPTGCFGAPEVQKVQTRQKASSGFKVAEADAVPSPNAPKTAEADALRPPDAPKTAEFNAGLPPNRPKTIEF